MSHDPWDVFVLAALEPLRGVPGVFVAPDIPAAVASGVLRDYLHLRPGELLLAIVDRSGGRDGRTGCTITNRGIHWHAANEESAAGPSPRPPSDTPGPPEGRWLEYSELGEDIALAGVSPSQLELNPACRISADAPRRVLETLARVLGRIARAAREGGVPPESDPDSESRARAVLPRVGQLSDAARSFGVNLRLFPAQLRSATPRVMVTPAVAVSCIAVFFAMAASGVSAVNPSPEALVAWGASFGPSVFLAGQPWRLATCMFLHIGFVHVLMNLWCLLQVGPLVERLFGNAAFAAIYLLSGVGGALASAWWHPLAVSAGASGALFGAFGALLGFLAVHRNAIPAAVLKSLRGSTFAFLGYNVAFGLVTPRIDSAAHLGGLATGLICGLLVQRRWPVAGSAAETLRRLVAVVAIAAGLALAFVAVDRHVRSRGELAEILRKG